MRKAQKLHDQAMELCERGMILDRQGRHCDAHDCRFKAFDFERDAANCFKGKKKYEPTRSVLYRSAASIAEQIGKYDEAMELVDEGLKGNPPADIKAELLEVRGRVLKVIKPVGVQLRRTKDWKLPPNTVVVSRPSKWGNPYTVEQFGTPEMCVSLYEDHAANMREQIRAELRGKNLACWCRLGEPCHREVLLKIANESEAK